MIDSPSLIVANIITMRVSYTEATPDPAVYRQALASDLGVYSNQTGAGLGGFLKKIFKSVIPIGKTILKQGFELAKPGLQDAGNQLVGAASNYAVNKIESGAKRIIENVGKRKVDQLS